MCLFFILFPTKETPSYHSLIHVPTRGTTSYKWIPENLKEVSIHVPSRGTTGLDGDRSSLIRVSIHVPTRGTTAILSKFSHILLLQVNNFFLYLPYHPLSLPSFSSFSHLFCANFSVRIPQGFYVCFLFAPNYKINVWSWAIPLSTPMCSTFV